MTKDEALKLALEALELHGQQYPHMVKGYCLDAITAIREALAQPEQEPVAYTTGHCENHKQKGGCQLHNLQCGWPDCDRKPITTPPQRKPLSNQKIIEMYNEPRSDAEMIEFARAIEAAHGIKE